MIYNKNKNKNKNKFFNVKYFQLISYSGLLVIGAITCYAVSP